MYDYIIFVLSACVNYVMIICLGFQHTSLTELIYLCFVFLGWFGFSGFRFPRPFFSVVNWLNGIDKQKAYFEMLDDVLDSPIYAAKNWRNKDVFKPGKQKHLGRGGHCPPIDHRSVGSNEIVIDLDARSYSMNAKYAIMISEYLNSQNIPHYNFWSGNKGIHIHIFLEVNIISKEGQEVIRKALKLGMNIWREIRINLARDFVIQSGLREDLMGIGKPIDLAKLSWNDLDKKLTLIRVCGGSNKKIDEFGKSTEAFKTYFTTIPTTKPKPIGNPFSFDEVVYPTTISKHLIPESFAVGLAKNYVDILNSPKVRRELEDIDFTGKYLGLPCVRSLLEGINSGKRAFAAQQIAISARLDGKDIDETKTILDTFVQNCSQVPEEFTNDEAYNWADWVFKQPEAYFACGLCVKLKVCEKFDCPYNEEKYKEDFAVFDVDNPLELVEKCLDYSIVGERRLKMQLFLLYLTKYFDPEWCIIIDGISSSGKSHVMKKVATLFGTEGEDYHTYSRITGAVLNRIEEEAKNWENSIVIIEEFQGTRAALEQLRVLISERQLKLLETVESKDASGSKVNSAKTTTIKLHNTLFVTCQAEQEDEGDQFRTRAWMLNTDQSKDQTKGITDFYLDDFGDELPIVDNDLISKVQAGISTLHEPHKVIFPFAKMLKGFLPNINTRARRDIKKFIALIKASALFHQKNRHWVLLNGKNILLADWRDVKVVTEYAWDTLMATTQGIGEKDLEYYNKIIIKVAYMPNFTIQDVARWCNVNLMNARKIMANLTKEGFFENTTKPPEKALYAQTTVSPVFNELNLDFEEFLKNQEKMLEEWIEKYKEKYKKNG